MAHNCLYSLCRVAIGGCMSCASLRLMGDKKCGGLWLPFLVRLERHSEWHKFTTGYHSTYKAARDNRVELSTHHTFPGPFVAAYRKGQRITVQEALLVSKQNWIP